MPTVAADVRRRTTGWHGEIRLLTSAATRRNSARAIYYLAEDRLELIAGLVLVLVGDLAHEAFGLVICYKIDSRATKSTAGQAGPETSGMGASQFHQQIKLRSAVLQKVSRAFMALEHVLAELAMIVVAQRPFARHHPLNFGNDVPGAFIFAGGQFGPVRFKGSELNGAQ